MIGILQAGILHASWYPPCKLISSKLVFSKLVSSKPVSWPYCPIQWNFRSRRTTSLNKTHYTPLKYFSVLLDLQKRRSPYKVQFPSYFILESPLAIYHVTRRAWRAYMAWFGNHTWRTAPHHVTPLHCHSNSLQLTTNASIRPGLQVSTHYWKQSSTEQSCCTVAGTVSAKTSCYSSLGVLMPHQAISGKLHASLNKTTEHATYITETHQQGGILPAAVSRTQAVVNS